MRLRHDIATRETTAVSGAGAERPWIGRSHAEELIIEVIDDGTAITGVTGATGELPAAFQMLFKLKPSRKRDTEPLVTDTAGEDLIITAADWDSDEDALIVVADTVNAAVDAALNVGNGDPEGDIATLLCDAEISYRASSALAWKPGRPFPVDLMASVNMEEDQTATLTAAQTGIRYYSAITALTGGGATALDGIATTGLSVPRIVSLYLSSQMHFWRLESGTTAEDGVGIVRPDDYHATTNAKIWKRVG